MNHDELSFVNQQLAGMLKSGVPLEGALRELCVTMQRGALKDELLALEADLAKGTPLKDAIARRKLPEFYVRMVQAGAQSGDLPGVLLMLADYYARANALWTRLKGLMVYPFIVLLVSLAVSTLLAVFLSNIADLWAGGFASMPSGGFNGRLRPDQIVWAPVAGLSLVLLIGLVSLIVPAARNACRARLPVFREAGCAQFASAMSLLLRGGSSLPDALELMRRVEGGSAIGGEVARWQTLLASGKGKLRDLTAIPGTFPPLFLWLVEQGGEDAAKGFSKAAEVYQARALHHIEVVLNAALPVTIIALGISVVAQVVPVFRMLVRMTDAL